MKRPEQHVMADDAEAALRSTVPSEWIVRSIQKDYGVDLEIEMVDQGIVTGNRIWVQLKAVQRVKKASIQFPIEKDLAEFGVGEDGKLHVAYVPFRIETKEIEYALRCPFPLLLFVVDLESKDIYWLPLRDEALINLSEDTPDWREHKTATVRIPARNQLSADGKSGYSGLRWYAMEPARMYAFALLHHYHHEFQYTGRLSGYEVGEGWVDHGEEEELRHSLFLAKSYLKSALELDVLFGDHGIEFYRLESIPGLRVPGIALQLQDAIDAADAALKALDSKAYDFMSIALLTGTVSHAMDLLSTAISSYQGFRGKHLLTKGMAVWRAESDLQVLDQRVVVPMKRGGRKSSNEDSP